MLFLRKVIRPLYRFKVVVIALLFHYADKGFELSVIVYRHFLFLLSVSLSVGFGASKLQFSVDRTFFNADAVFIIFAFNKS